MLGHFLGSPFAAQQIKIDRACNLPAQALELLALVRLGGDARSEKPPTLPASPSSEPLSAGIVCSVVTLRPACAPVTMR